MNEVDPMEEFRAIILPRFARLAEQAGEYISRMSKADREFVLDAALEAAYENHVTLVGFEYGTLKTWDNILKGSIESRETWSLRYLTGWEIRTAADVIAMAHTIGEVGEDDEENQSA